MFIHLRGTEEGQEDDPIFFVPPSPLDAPILQAPLSKERREDLQSFSFALALSLSFDCGHPIGITAGDDPPDRMFRSNGISHAVELTELTITDVRRELAQARQLGRLLHERLMRDRGRFEHLITRRIVLAVLPIGDGLPRDVTPLLEQLSHALEGDRGGVGDDLAVSDGLPEQWPNNYGFYGEFGPVNVSVYRDGVPDNIVVASVCQTEVRLSQTLEVLNQRIHDKDIEGSEILLISCGMVDKKGFVCPIDQLMFRFLLENLPRIRLEPTHLSGIFLHLWGTSDWVELFRSNTLELAWLPPQAPLSQ